MPNIKKLIRDRWGITFAIIFVVISIFVINSRGDLPSIFVEETEFGGDTTFLGKILMVIVFPFALLGLTIEGLVPNNVFLVLVLLLEYIYGFIFGLFIKFGFGKIGWRK